MTRREASSEIDETAALWATRIDAAELSAQELAEFDAWLDGDTRRVGAFARAQAVLVHVRRAKALGTDFVPEDFAESGVEPDFAGDQPPAANEPAAPVLTRRRLLIGASAIAASGVIAVILPGRQAAAHIYETSLGETRHFPLADGSTVTLNTSSKVAVTIDKERRRIDLLRGEALFKVGTDNRAPFVVAAGDTSLSARDATFTLCRLDEQPLKLRVCEGNVEVTRDDAAAAVPRRIHAHMQAVMLGNGAVIARAIAPDVLERELAWQEGMLSFEDTPLRNAADEFARYSSRRIDIPDAMVGAETVTGRFASNNPDGFARAAALSLNLHVQSTASGIIISR